MSRRVLLPLLYLICIGACVAGMMKITSGEARLVEADAGTESAAGILDEISNEPSPHSHAIKDAAAETTVSRAFLSSGELAEAFFTGGDVSRPVDGGLIDFAAAYNPYIREELFAELSENGYDESVWHRLTGYTLAALYDLYTENPDVRDMGGTQTATLAFTGDVNLADDWYIMSYLKRYGGGVTSAFDERLLDRMRGADVLTINHEFTFSDGGSPLPGKQYTFRSSPDNASMLLDMGVDVAGLANNHCWDYGADAFADTMRTLREAGIPYVGAGADIAEASKPLYLIAGGVKIAIVAASRAEKYILTPEATETSSGVLRTYDNARFVSVIKEAAANADYVIAYVHWGTENSTVLEAAQTDGAREYIDAGADAVVGTHPHCLQGVDFYNGCPIIYSLGNFWFNLETVDTALLELTAGAEGTVSVRMVPCVQTYGKTTDVTGSAAGDRILEHLRSLSPNVEIDAEGLLTPSAE